MKQEAEARSKLCPFKKIVEQDHNGNTGKVTINERFAPCAGDRCMAYNSYGCSRLDDWR